MLDKTICAQLELAAAIMQQKPQSDAHTIAVTVATLGGYAKSLRKRYSQSFKTRAPAWFDTRTRNMESKAKRLAESMGLEMGINRDPQHPPVLVYAGRHKVSLG